jgi:uncharacterized membrane protein YdjX (TVP38/TMEM64 family)
MPSTTPREKKVLLLKLAVGLGVVAVVAGLVLSGVDVRGLFQRGLEAVRAAGPLAFFVAMAVLPAVGAPLLVFMLPAGKLFGERLGMPVVVACSLAAITFNLLFTYWLARWALRPPLARLIERLGYKLPQVASGDATDLVIILRVTQGIPFLVQNYLCGLAEVPFAKYAVVSCLAGWPAQVAYIVFGQALLEGNGRTILIAIGALAALVAAAHLVRRHYGRNRGQSSRPT